VAQQSPAGAGTLVWYRDVALTALTSTDMTHAAAFVEAELGALGATDEGTRRIAETVRVYLAEGRNRARASRVLGLHANTIAYRLGQAAELLGHDLDERSAEVQVALMIAPLLPGGE
jgi:DNA-binding PucR family transcriptional regulator